jgi:hypothetical protein
MAPAYDVELKLLTIGLNGELNHIARRLVDKAVLGLSTDSDLSVVIEVI